MSVDSGVPNQILQLPEQHTSINCEYVVKTLWTDCGKKVFVHIRKCHCPSFIDRYQSFQYMKGRLNLPVDGIDVHSLEMCHHEKIQQMTGWNNSIIKFNLRCFCNHLKATVKIQDTLREIND